MDVCGVGIPCLKEQVIYFIAFMKCFIILNDITSILFACIFYSTLMDLFDLTQCFDDSMATLTYTNHLFKSLQDVILPSGDL